MNEKHIPVLLKKVIELLHIKNQGLYIDATLGAGGHSYEILTHGGNVLGLDIDPKMLEIAQKRLETCPTVDESRPTFKLINANFSTLLETAKKNNFYPTDGILLDLGISSVHFDDMDRGFSFKNPDAQLDMRLNPDKQGVKASDLVNSLHVDQLTDLFELGMTRWEATKLAKNIIDYRKTNQPIETVGDFLRAGRFYRFVGKTHPATKAFMAIRIATNTELENLEQGLKQGFETLGKNGIFAIISFHSGEDRMVKTYFKELIEKGLAENLTKEAIKPETQELIDNPRSRSAILRVIRKI
ncbi:MAG: 16S rRNA (cytosine(1402)-N(4))-methyltransferase RsmH [Patescibacteria group bacterium]